MSSSATRKHKEVHVNTMNQNNPRQQTKRPNPAVKKNPRSPFSPKAPSTASPSSSSSPPSPPSSPPSSSRRSESPSTGPSTPIYIPQNPSSDSQPIQHPSDPSSKVAIHVFVSLSDQPGQWQTAQFPSGMFAAQPVSAVHNTSEPTAEEKEKSAPVQSQVESETEIERLNMKVKELTSEVGALGSKVIEQGMQLEDKTSELEEKESELKQLKSELEEKKSELKQLKSELQEANKECVENAEGNLNLQNGITDRIFEVMSFLREHGSRKDVYKTWQNQQMPNDDSIVNGKLIERQKGIDSIFMEDYVLRLGEIDRLEQALEDEKHKRGEDVKRLEQALEDEKQKRSEDVKRLEQALEDEKQKRSGDVERLEQALEDEKQKRGEDVERLELELIDQVAREREIREQAEEQAREYQHMSEQFVLEREARNQAQEQAREQAAGVQNARGQVAEVQALNDTLTQENNTLRTLVEELQNQQNGTQKRNNALEAQNGYEEEICYLLFQMAEMRGATWSEADLWRIIETLEKNPREPFNESSQSRSSPPLRWSRKGGKLRLESKTPDGQWQQTDASQYAQQFPNSRVGLIVRIARYFHS